MFGPHIALLLSSGLFTSVLDVHTTTKQSGMLAERWDFYTYCDWVFQS